VTTKRPVQRVRSPFGVGACVAVAVALASVWAAGVAAAASPAPPGPSSGVQAWLDAPFAPPPDMPTGGHIAVGLTLWDPAAGALGSLDGVYARVYPAKGNAQPTFADATTDWPGHLLLQAAPPKGGPGRIEFGIRGPDCPPPAPCTDRKHPLRLAGTGPPPDAPMASLVEEQTLPIVGDVVAGRPLKLAVMLLPRGEWDGLDLPDRVVAIATSADGKDLGSAELPLSAGESLPYVGELTIPDTGAVDLSFALPGNGSQPDQVIDGDPTRVNVIDSGLRRDATPRPGASAVTGGDAPAQAATGDLSSLVWVGLAGLLIVAGVLFFGGTVRGWLRRGGDDR
jgi:hypothetical protein